MPSPPFLAAVLEPSPCRMLRSRWCCSARCRTLAINWLRVSPGRQICLKAAAELDFQALLPDRVGSSFLEHQNGWKPPWASDSHAVGSRTVRAICLAAPFPRQPWSRTEAGFVQDLQLCSAAALSGLSVEATADRQG